MYEEKRVMEELGGAKRNRNKKKRVLGGLGQSGERWKLNKALMMIIMGNGHGRMEGGKLAISLGLLHIWDIQYSTSTPYLCDGNS